MVIIKKSVSKKKLSKKIKGGMNNQNHRNAINLSTAQKIRNFRLGEHNNRNNISSKVNLNSNVAKLSNLNNFNIKSTKNQYNNLDIFPKHIKDILREHNIKNINDLKEKFKSGELKGKIRDHTISEIENTIDMLQSNIGNLTNNALKQHTTPPLKLNNNNHRNFKEIRLPLPFIGSLYNLLVLFKKNTPINMFWFTHVFPDLDPKLGKIIVDILENLEFSHRDFLFVRNQEKEEYMEEIILYIRQEREKVKIEAVKNIINKLFMLPPDTTKLLSSSSNTNLSDQDRDILQKVVSWVNNQVKTNNKKKYPRFLENSKNSIVPKKYAMHSLNKNKIDEKILTEIINSKRFSGKTIYDLDLSKKDLTDLHLNNVSLRKVNLSEANLSGAKFVEVKFDEVDFSGANLNGATFKECILKNIKFKKSTMNHVILERTKIIDAIFDNASLLFTKLNRTKIKNSFLKAVDLSNSEIFHCEFEELGMENVKLRESKIKGTKFIKVKLEESDLESVKIDSVKFLDTVLDTAKLNYAEITRSLFTETKLIGTELNNSIIENVNFTKCRIRTCEFKEAIITGLILKDSPKDYLSFHNINFSKAKLNKIDLSSIKYANGKFINADLIGANLKNIILNRANFTGANLTGTNLEGAKLEGTPLIGADLTGANLTKVNFTSAKLNNANLNNANLTNANLTNANLQDSNLSRANLTGANLEGANLTGANLTGANLNNIKYNPDTKFPYDFNHPETKKINVLSNNMISSQNDYCNYKLYNKIMSLSYSELKSINRFKVYGKSGIDVGGITRIIHSVFSKDFYHKFFTYQDENCLLRPYYKLGDLISATNFLLILTEKTKKVWGHSAEVSPGSVNFIPIKQDLLDLLLADNLEDYIKLENKKKFGVSQNFNGITYNKLNKNQKNIFGITKLEDALVKNNNNNNNNNNSYRINWNKKINNSVPIEQFNSLLETDKKKVYLRIFLEVNGFKSYNQFIKMRKWIQRYWKPNSKMFTNKVSYSQGDIFERIYLNYDGKEVLLSNFDKESNTNKQELYSFYKTAKSLIAYLKESNENRKDFCQWVTGSETYIGYMFIKFFRDSSDRLYLVHTCSNTIDVFNNELEGNNKTKIDFWKGIVKSDLSKTSIEEH